jgi:hypothetical protein
VGDPQRVLDGDLDPFIRSFLLFRKTGKIMGPEGEDEE